MTDAFDTIAAIDAAQEPAGSPDPAAAAPGPRRSRRSPLARLRRTAGGIGAVGVKESRGRMRGRRAFVILTCYLLLLAGFAWMVEQMMERTYATGFGGNAAFATAAIGQGIFAGLLMLETLLVAFLAPMATAGSISLEREKQTLEMLAATPITSVAIVLGKLLSALVYVWLLIAASIPLTAIVFVFGGVAPEDLLHGYLVLIVTALGFGSFGLLCSSLVKRTQAATAITIFGVLAVSVGTLFFIVFWQSIATATDNRVGAGGSVSGSAPAPMVYLNPFLAQADIAPTEVLCATDTALRYYCRFRSVFLSDQPGVVFNGTNGGGVVIDKDTLVGAPPPAIAVPANGVGGVLIAPERAIPADIVPFGAATESVWERTVIAWLILSLVFLLISVQFVTPTRRWHLRPGPRPAQRDTA